MYLFQLLVCTFALLSAPVAFAHSLHELETDLGSREKYFQPIDKPAPKFALRDASRSPVTLLDFRGKVVVLHFVYIHCPDVCPLHAERIAVVQTLVNNSPMKQQVEFLTVTTDPSRDRGAALKEYGRAHGLDLSNWKFLTTAPDQSEDTTRQLAQQFGHRFEKTEDGLQMHSIVTHVIDKEGRWRANFHGLKFEPSNLVIFINALVNDFDKHSHAEPSFWQRMKSWF